jgi:hypothetical protein
MSRGDGDDMERARTATTSDLLRAPDAASADEEELAAIREELAETRALLDRIVRAVDQLTRSREGAGSLGRRRESSDRARPESRCRSSAKERQLPTRDYSSASAPGSDLPSMAAIRAPVAERDENGGERNVQLVHARNPRPSPDVGTGADYQLTPSC